MIAGFPHYSFGHPSTPFTKMLKRVSKVLGVPFEDDVGGCDEAHTQRENSAAERRVSAGTKEEQQQPTRGDVPIRHSFTSSTTSSSMLKRVSKALGVPILEDDEEVNAGKVTKADQHHQNKLKGVYGYAYYEPDGENLIFYLNSDGHVPKQELDFVNSFDSKSFAPNDQCYLIDSNWLMAWYMYASEKTHDPLPAIDNEKLLNSEKNGLSEHVKVKTDFRPISKTVWEYLFRNYGGGPVLTFYVPSDLPDKEYQKGSWIKKVDLATAVIVIKPKVLDAMEDLQEMVDEYANSMRRNTFDGDVDFLYSPGGRGDENEMQKDKEVSLQSLLILRAHDGAILNMKKEDIMETEQAAQQALTANVVSLFEEVTKGAADVKALRHAMMTVNVPLMQTIAVRIICRWWRRMLKAQKYVKLKARKYQLKVEHSAIKLQSLYRVRICRRKLRLIQQEKSWLSNNKAAETIQSWWYQIMQRRTIKHHDEMAKLLQETEDEAFEHLPEGRKTVTVQFSDFQATKLINARLCVVRVTIGGKTLESSVCNARDKGSNEILEWTGNVTATNVEWNESTVAAVEVVQIRPLKIRSERVHGVVYLSLPSFIESAIPRTTAAATTAANNNNNVTNRKYELRSPVERAAWFNLEFENSLVTDLLGKSPSKRSSLNILPSFSIKSSSSSSSSIKRKSTGSAPAPGCLPAPLETFDSPRYNVESPQFKMRVRVFPTGMSPEQSQSLHVGSSPTVDPATLNSTQKTTVVSSSTGTRIIPAPPPRTSATDFHGDDDEASVIGQTKFKSLFGIGKVLKSTIKRTKKGKAIDVHYREDPLVLLALAAQNILGWIPPVALPNPTTSTVATTLSKVTAIAGGGASGAHATQRLSQQDITKVNSAVVVIIELLRMRNIPMGSNFTEQTSAYMEVSLMSPFSSSPKTDEMSSSASRVIAQTQRSTLKPGTLYPVWEPKERFYFLLPPSSAVAAHEGGAGVYNYAPKFQMSVVHYGLSSAPNVIGDAFVSWKDICAAAAPNPVASEAADPTDPVKKTCNIIRSADGVSRGEIDILVSRVSLLEALSLHHEVLYEYQRWQPIVGWGNKYPGHLLPTDPGKWSTVDGRLFSHEWEALAVDMPYESAHVSARVKAAAASVTKAVSSSSSSAAAAAAVAQQQNGSFPSSAAAAVPKRVCLIGWHTRATETEPEGWEYALDFASPYWYPKGEGARFMVRRRQWHRLTKLDDDGNHVE